MKEKKFSESIAHVMEYIKFSEMGGEIDETDPYYTMYLGLKDLLWKVKDEEEILDEDTQMILPAFQPTEPKLTRLDLPDIKDPDIEMEFALWDCIDHGDKEKEGLV
jgi:hypothetical protein